MFGNYLNCITDSNPRQARVNSDKILNNAGRRLIELCRSLNLIIMNGRYGKDINIGKKTCKNASTVDYIIISHNFSEYVSDFEVLDFDPSLSDIHCAVYAAFKPDTLNSSDKNINEPVIRLNPKTSDFFKWKSEGADSFKNQLSRLDITHIELNLNAAESEEERVSTEHINHIVDNVCEVLKQAASDSGMSKQVKPNNGKPRKRTLPHKPWYNSDCESARRTMHSSKNKYRKLKNVDNLNLTKDTCKQYKKNYK